MSELLLEIYVEEIPAMMQRNAQEAYVKIFETNLSKAAIKADSITSYIGPRRIAIHINNMSKIETGIAEEIRGPKTNAPEQALQGFLSKYQIHKEDLYISMVNEQEYYFYKQRAENKSLEEKLALIIEESIMAYIWPKSMYWGRCANKFVRPVRNILCLLNDRILPVKLFDLTANNLTYGHRFINNKKIEINKIAEYKTKLLEAKVILGHHERGDKISQEIQDVIGNNSSLNDGLRLSEDANLLEEVTGLVEYPFVRLGRICEDFMHLPSEILISSMRTHQKYFTLQDAMGKFAPYFIFVANIEGDDREIVEGNERVLSSRLTDAKYFYEQDNKTDMASKNIRLKRMIFHENVGSIYNKVQRIVKLAEYVQPDNEILKSAAISCKADLVTEAVDEFPELQGVIGGYLAEKEFGKNVATCIKQHYMPLHVNGELPTGDAAMLSLIDKLDNLVALYVAGERATGSKDPYALRRQAISIIRIIIANQFRVNLGSVLKFAIELAANDCVHKIDSNQIYQELLGFIEERCKNLLAKEFTINQVEAVFGLTKYPDIYQNYQKLQSLASFMSKPEGADLVTIYARTNNILVANKYKTTSSVNKDLFKKEELSLYNELNLAFAEIEEALNSDKYNLALAKLSTLLGPINIFFEKIQIVTDDKQASSNRLQLLADLTMQFDKLANFQALIK